MTESRASSMDGKVALVTGGTSGIGRATALAFARRGANIVICGRNEERGAETLDAIRGEGTEGELVLADLASLDEVRRLVRTTTERFGRIDFAVNNAAEVGATKPLAETSEEDFDRVVAVDLRSVWLCMKLEIEQMLAQDPPGGAIVNTASINALGGVPSSSLYAMAKAGVVALTKSAALETARSGIRVNALVPGAIRTPMLEGVIDRMSGGDEASREAVEQTLEGMVPAGRAGRPEEAAEAAVWLCSEEASFVTGHSMIVDGGMTAPYR